MAIDKITPLRLDKTSDFKVIPETSMVDALNMLISENEAFGGSVNDGSESGDLGVLKNLKGNASISPGELGDIMFEGDAKVIGSVTDTKLKILYFFVWHSLPDQHGVWAYDPMGKLPGAGNLTGRIRKIHKSNLYNFPQHGFVKGDIIYTSQSRLNDSDIKPGTERDFEKDAILYFTDNTNEPRKLNVYMALTGEEQNYTQESDRIDYITACPKVPLTPITFQFESNPDKVTSGFKAGPGFQFAYQFVYKDGMETAISPYSDIAFSPGIIHQGTIENIPHILHNKCQLRIPVNGENIESIKILARQWNNPEMVLLEEVSVFESGDNWDHESRTYSFYNDRIVKGVSQNEVNKQYDNLPRKAQAQAVVDNRLMYGNYLEGFDNVKTQCEAVVTFKEREKDGINHVIRLIPAISEQHRAYNQEYAGDMPDDTAINKSAAYIIDTSDLPAYINEGTQVTIVVSLAPALNFHVYQATNSYHQSRHKGGFNVYHDQDIDYNDPDTYDGSPWQEPSGATPFPGYMIPSDSPYGDDTPPPYGHQSLNTSGATFIDQHRGENDMTDYVPYAGNNFGVGGAGAFNDADGGLQGGDYPGSGSYTSPIWKTANLGESPDEQFEVTYGTSAGNPLIIQGKKVSFSCSFITGGSSGSGQKMIQSQIIKLLTGQTSSWGGGEESGFLNVQQLQTKYSYDINLGIENFNQYNEGSPITKMITGVMKKTNFGEYNPWASPIGYFVINRARVTFSLEEDVNYSTYYDKGMIRLVLDKIEPHSDDSEVDVVTMVKKMWPGQPWQALTKEYLTGNNFADFNEGTATLARYSTDDYAGEEGGWHPPLLNTIDDFDYKYAEQLLDWHGNIQTSIDNNFISDEDLYVNWYLLSTGQNNLSQLQDQLFFGYLDFQQNGIVDNLFRFNRDAYSQTNHNTSPFEWNRHEIFPFSLLDGEGGPGGTINQDGTGYFGTADAVFYQGDTSQPVTSGGSTVGAGLAGISIYTAAAMYLPPQGYSSVPRTILMEHIGGAQFWSFSGVSFHGSMTNSTMPMQGLTSYMYHFGGPGGRSWLPLMQGRQDEDAALGYDGLVIEGAENIYSDAGEFGTNFRKKHSHVEVLQNLQLVIMGPEAGDSELIDRTFKTSASHDFGIIYYDERGRHGFVNHLKTVYVAGYSQLERNIARFGRNEITLDIQHDPPEWAYYYKLAYTGNTSVENFIQYTAGGAYMPPDPEWTIIEKDKIYISLNYLQESPISYVSDWGARDPEGGLNMFKYLPGRQQKLRVISAYDFSQNIQYFYNYEFEIVDFVILGEEDNALTTSPETEPQKSGAFVVIRNNPDAFGFTSQEVKEGQDLWDNNCIIELYTPARDHERFYYEIGDTYDVNQPGTAAAAHSQTSITLKKGDVWWRKVPLNVRPFDNELTEYVDLIKAADNVDEPNPSVSNFIPYYLETETATDLFKADASLIGRPNIISEDAVESIREATITYSDQNNPNSSKVNYSSFNLTLLNFKDLQEEFGDINYMCNMEGDVFVIQSDRCTLVPASKTLFSDVSGIDTVAASKSPLGQERIYAGRAGCDNNPESAVQVGSYVYFAHKNLGKVFRFNPSNGVQVISDQGMASYFRTLFQEAMASSQDLNHNDIRVVGGFDPVQEEYLLTVLYNTTFEDALPGPVEDISYEEDIVDIGVIDPFADIDQVPDEVAQQFNEVFLGRIPDGVEIDMSADLYDWFHLLEGPIFDTLNFGVIERTPSGLELTRDFYISNMGSESVFVKIRPSYPLKFYANSKYPTQFGQGHYRNPSFKHIKNELGITQVGEFGLENVKTLIPAGTYHTFTMTINVNELEHSYTGGYAEPNFSISSTEATQYLIDTFGTTKRALTSSERALGGENIPNELLATRNYYDSMQASPIEFEVYNLADQLILGVDDIGSYPYRRKEWRYQIMDSLEGDLLPGTPDVVTETAEYADYSADIDGDGFVGSQDVLDLLASYGDIGDNLTGDIDNDGAVTVNDLLILLNQFGGDAPSVYDVLDVPPLDLDAFAQAVATASVESIYEGVTELNLDDLLYYYEIVPLAGEGLVSTVLFNQFPEVWNFIGVGGDFVNVLNQVYFTDDNGNFIPYGGSAIVESGAPAFDLCAWPVLKNEFGVVDISSAMNNYGNLGNEAFFGGLPPYVGSYVGLDFNTFMSTYLMDDNGQPIAVQCYNNLQEPSLSVVSFGINLNNSLTNTYGVDTSSATTYIDLYSINVAVSEQILSDIYPDVWAFLSNMVGYWGDNFEQVYLTGANGVAIPFDGGGMPGGPGGSGGGGYG